MQFNSWEFLFFMFFVYSIYWILRNFRSQNIFLLLCSYYFYAAWDWRFLSLIITSTVTDYICGHQIHKAVSLGNRKLWLIISIVVNLSLLGFFKYYNFFIQSAGIFLSTFGLSPDSLYLNIILPVGISFYTFQTMSYSLDIYQGHLKPIKSLTDFALFVSFFPQLVAGPIERAKNLVPQLIKKRIFNKERLITGLTLIGWGLWKKIVIADNLGYIVDDIYLKSKSATLFTSYLSMNAFNWQVYCDFSAYSDIARGSARILGFELMRNFNLPFFAPNINDCWRRWHISLTTWLRDYLYRPIGGNRHSNARTAFNVFFVMALCGLWHGAGWNYALWGVYLGTGMIIYNSFVKARRTPKTVKHDFRWVINVIFTYHFFIGATLFFRSSRHIFKDGRYVDDSANQMLEMFTSYRNGLGLDQDGFAILLNISLFIIPMIAIQCFQYFKNDHLYFLKLGFTKRTLFLSFLVLYFLYFGIQGGDQFVYFQF